MYNWNLWAKDQEEIKDEVIKEKEQHKEFQQRQNIIIADLQDQKDQGEELIEEQKEEIMEQQEQIIEKEKIIEYDQIQICCDDPLIIETIDGSYVCENCGTVQNAKWLLSLKKRNRIYDDLKNKLDYYENEIINNEIKIEELNKQIDDNKENEKKLRNVMNENNEINSYKKDLQFNLGKLEKRTKEQHKH